MKNRTWLPRGLDILGIIALIVAGAALVGAISLAASSHEALLLTTFKYGLMAAVSAFIVARACEISGLLQNSTEPQAQVQAVPDNVETLAAAKSLPRAA